MLCYDCVLIIIEGDTDEGVPWPIAGLTLPNYARSWWHHGHQPFRAGAALPGCGHISAPKVHRRQERVR